MKKLLTIAASIVALSASSQAALNIQFNFSNGNDAFQIGDTVVSAANQSIFNNAKSFWENNITGYQDGTSRTITINVSGFSSGAVNNRITLGAAGPRNLTTMGHEGNTYILATTGIARFNTHDDATNSTGILDELTIRHEVGHILGIGTLWDTSIFGSGFVDVYDPGTGQYFGANGLAAYNNEFGADGLYIPVELDGGPGTADGHWNEVGDNFGGEVINEVVVIHEIAGLDSDPGDGASALTVLSGINAGRSLDEALMTGILSENAFLSDTTLGSLQDIGFTTVGFNTVSAVPEPSSTGLFALGSLSLLLRRKR